MNPAHQHVAMHIWGCRNGGGVGVWAMWDAKRTGKDWVKRMCSESGRAELTWWMICQLEHSSRRWIPTVLTQEPDNLGSLGRWYYCGPTRWRRQPTSCFNLIKWYPRQCRANCERNSSRDSATCTMGGSFLGSPNVSAPSKINMVKNKINDSLAMIKSLRVGSPLQPV